MTELLEGTAVFARALFVLMKTKPGGGCGA